jgi:hypothetical protein
VAGYSATFSVVDEATKQIDAINKRIQAMRAPFDRLQKQSAKFLDVSGLKKVAEGFVNIGRSVVKTVESMGRMIGALAGITGAATIAGIAALTRQFLNLGTMLERNADSMQLTTEQLQNMQNAVTLAGGSADDMTNALKALTAASVQAKTAGGLQAELFRKYGISLDDANGKLRDAASLMPEVIAKINSYADGRQRAMVADQLGGQALAELAEDFRRSRESYEVWMKKAQKYSLVLNPDLLRQYRQAVGALQVSFTELGTAVSGVLADALSPLIHDFADWIHTHQPQIVKGIRDLVTWFQKWFEGPGPGKLLDALKEVGKVLAFVANHAQGIAEIFAVAWGVKAVAGVVALITQMRILNALVLARGAAAGAAAASTAGGAAAGGAGVAGGAAAGAGLAGAAAVGAGLLGLGAAGWGLYKHFKLYGATGLDPSAFAGSPDDKPKYQQGGIVPALLHAGEMVLPEPISRGLQALFMGGAGGGQPKITNTNPLPVTLIPNSAFPGGGGPAGGSGVGFTSGITGGGGLLGSPLGPGTTVNPYAGGGGGGGYTPPADLGKAGPATGGDPRGMIPVIRAAAIANGINPDIAVRVAQHEGLGKFLGDHGKSGGAFQLFTGGGEGNLFQQQTGLNPLDPKNERQSIWWAMNRVRTTGWGPWHGAAKAGIYGQTGIGPMPAGTPSPYAGATPNTPGGGAAGTVVDQMVAMAGTRGAAVRQFLRDPEGKIRQNPNDGNWCAEYVQAYLRHLGITGPGGGKNLMAASFRDFGKEIAYQNVAKGDILVNKDLRPHHAHVGVATGLTRMHGGVLQVQEYSSNSLDAAGHLLNLPGLRWRNDVNVRRSDELAMAEARGLNRTMVAQNGGVNGSVDINVRHTNPPVGSTVMASATGQGVRVGDPRVEHQHFDSP